MAGDLRSLGKMLSGGSNDGADNADLDIEQGFEQELDKPPMRFKAPPPPPRESEQARSAPTPVASQQRFYDPNIAHANAATATAADLYPDEDDPELVDQDDMARALAALKKKKRAKARKRWAIFGISLSTLIILAGGGFEVYWLFLKKPPNPIPVSVRTQLSFPTYYPATLPAGFSVKTDSINQPTKGTMVMVIQDNAGHKISVSEQAAPASFDFGQTFGAFSNTSQVQTPIGAATVGSGTPQEGPIIASLITDKTWIIANTSRNLTADQFKAFLMGLRKS